MNDVPSRYHVVRATVVMALGGLAILGGLLFLALVLVAAVGGDGLLWAVLWWTLLVACVAIGLGLLRSLWRLARPPVGLTLDDTGYTLDPLVGAGTRSATWADVAHVESVERGGDLGVVVHLHDGTTSRIVARMVAEPMATWLADVDARLNRAHGQRRL